MESRNDIKHKSDGLIWMHQPGNLKGLFEELMWICWLMDSTVNVIGHGKKTDIDMQINKLNAHIWGNATRYIRAHPCVNQPLLSLYTSTLGLLDVLGVISSIAEGVFDSSGIFFNTSPWDGDKYLYQVIQHTEMFWWVINSLQCTAQIKQHRVESK